MTLIFHDICPTRTLYSSLGACEMIRYELFVFAAPSWLVMACGKFAKQVRLKSHSFCWLNLHHIVSKPIKSKAILANAWIQNQRLKKCSQPCLYRSQDEDRLMTSYPGTTSQHGILTPIELKYH